MSDLLDSKVFEFDGGAFVDEPQKSDSFIPTSLSDDEVPTKVDSQASWSLGEIARMVKELEELMAIKCEKVNPLCPLKGVLFVQGMFMMEKSKKWGKTLNCILIGMMRKMMKKLQFSVEEAPPDEHFFCKDFVSKPTIKDFCYFYNIKNVGHHNGFCCFGKWANSEVNRVKDMTLLKNALVLNRKSKTNKELTTPSCVNPLLKRKIDAIETPIINLSKKQHMVAHERGRNFDLSLI
uniref:Uncharacterized protein n=1 Tax=Cannabis sativa TaxID=3483 RepID=A0A803QRM5_CANSA